MSPPYQRIAPHGSRARNRSAYAYKKKYAFVPTSKPPLWWTRILLGYAIDDGAAARGPSTLGGGVEFAQRTRTIACAHHGIIFCLASAREKNGAE